MRILVFGAHPDDVEIGMGATIKRFTDAGCKVLIVIVSVPNQRDLRFKEAENAARILGSQVKILDIEPASLKQIRPLVRIFDKIIEEFKPHKVFTHWIYDSHQDHVDVTTAVIATSRKNQFDLYMYEITMPGGITPYAFNEQLFIDVTKHFNYKLKAIKAHKSQITSNGENWIGGLEGRARAQGHKIGVKYAEVFEIVKEIRKYKRPK